MQKHILLDIEGTTTSINFVHDILFPYSSKELRNFLTENADLPELEKPLKLVKKSLETEQQIPNPTIEQCIINLLSWIKSDRKHPGLKTIQGLIWQAGYENQAYKGHVYPDLLDALARWQNQGTIVSIYSSGSVKAQKLLFEYSNFGNLQPYISNYFDTRVGHKQDPISYENIIRKLAVDPDQVTFYSDSISELRAAHSSGMHTRHVVREDSQGSKDYPCIFNFKRE